MLPKPARLRSSKDIRRVYSGRRCVSGGLLALHWRPSGLEGTRAAFTVGKKVGGAAARNRVRRRLREACRVWLPRIRPGVDIVIVARAAAAAARFTELECELTRLLRGSGLVKDEGADAASAGFPDTAISAN